MIAEKEFMVRPYSKKDKNLKITEIVRVFVNRRIRFARETQYNLVCDSSLQGCVYVGDFIAEYGIAVSFAESFLTNHT